MRLRQALVIGAAMLGFTQTVSAAGEVKVLMPPTCEQWLQLTSNGKKKWLLGFMSGLNRGYAINHRGHDPLEKLESSKELFEWMEGYCKANPTLDVAEGGFAFFRELKGR